MENQNTNEIPVEQENAATDAVQGAASTNKDWQAYNVAKKDRNLFARAIENGTLLPGEDGKVDTSNARSLVRGTKYQGMTNIILKSFTKENNFPTNEFVTANQLDHVNMTKQLPFEDSVKIKKGEKGITIHISEKKKDDNERDIIDQETGKPVYETKYITLFNIAQIENVQPVMDFAKEEVDRRLEWAKSQKNYREPNPDKIRETVQASSGEPTVYLSEYFNAVEKGKDFSATPEIAEEFKAKANEVLFGQAKTQEERDKANPFNFAKLSIAVNKLHKEQRKEISQKIRNEKAREKYNQRLADYAEKHALQPQARQQPQVQATQQEVPDDYEMCF